ncbi:hypothetical protein BpHYR1_030742 [Brachionus plicatilis]|uniref:Uncharacterized protein n=1 Tax=Brachionus plicatilis TaxID=10195 RepID=A0A3M7PTT9_BRAPC|nr:hypothetical protein BpHYR1_030742 [Brachionus plicatilis]
MTFLIDKKDKEKKKEKTLYKLILQLGLQKLQFLKILAGVVAISKKGETEYVAFELIRISLMVVVDQGLSDANKQISLLFNCQLHLFYFKLNLILAKCKKFCTNVEIIRITKSGLKKKIQCKRNEKFMFNLYLKFTTATFPCLYCKH